MLIVLVVGACKSGREVQSVRQLATASLTLSVIGLVTGIIILIGLITYYAAFEGGKIKL